MIYSKKMIKALIKDRTVWIGEINYELVTVIRVVCRVYVKYNKLPVITSANDSIHAENSLHPKNLAWDFRIWGIDDSTTKEIDEMKICADEIRHELNAIDFRYTVIYGNDEHLDHMHIEYNVNKKQQPQT